MPYVIVGSGKRTCVHVKNPDGSAGKPKHCYDGEGHHERALAYMRALYVNVPEASSKGFLEMSKLTRMKEKERRQRRRLQKAQEEKNALEILETEEIGVEEEDGAILASMAGETLEDDQPIEEGEATEKNPIGEKDEVKSIEKDMDEMVTPMPMMGPTSFDELDAARVAREQASEVRQITYDVQDLVYNIVGNPMMDASAKAKAIQMVGSDFEGRFTGIVGKDTHKDLDLLELEALIAYDNRGSGLGEKVGDALTVVKEVMSSRARMAQPDSSYAMTTTYQGKKIRKYLIHDKAHVRNALARAAQQIKRGVEPFSGWARAALPKIRVAAKSMGIEASTAKERNAIVITKDAKGDWRWVGWVSNNFMDWDGDIISKEAHEEFVDWLDQHPEWAPAFLSWHTPKTIRKNRVDFWDFSNGFLIMSGKLEPPEAEGLFKAQKVTNLGMSHGTLVLSRDPTDQRVITKYRMYEASDLALENAANPFTTLEVCAKEVQMDKQKYLAEILGSPEKAAAYLELAGAKQKELQEAGIEQKEVRITTPASGAPASDTPIPAPSATLAPDQVTEMIKAVEASIDIPGLNDWVTMANESIEKVPVLEEIVKSLLTSQDDRLAEALTPPASRLAWAQKSRASQDDATILKPKNKKDDELSKAAPAIPDDYWLSQATQTAPVNAEQAS